MIKTNGATDGLNFRSLFQFQPPQCDLVHCSLKLLSIACVLYCTIMNKFCTDFHKIILMFQEYVSFFLQTESILKFYRMEIYIKRILSLWPLYNIFTPKNIAVANCFTNQNYTWYKCNLFEWPDIMTKAVSFSKAALERLCLGGNSRPL